MLAVNAQYHNLNCYKKGKSHLRFADIVLSFPELLFLPLPTFSSPFIFFTILQQRMNKITIISCFHPLLFRFAVLTIRVQLIVLPSLLVLPLLTLLLALLLRRSVKKADFGTGLVLLFHLLYIQWCTLDRFT